MILYCMRSNFTGWFILPAQALFIIFIVLTKHMRTSIIIFFLFIIAGLKAQVSSKQPGFDKNNFYAVIASESVEAINQQLKFLQGNAVILKEGFEGALLMKKAGLVNKLKEKLNLFKSGHKKLESCIQSNLGNAELRFLRLIIQEHAPAILGYRSDLQQDKAYIIKSFKGLPPELQKSIVTYSKHSKILTPEDL